MNTPADTLVAKFPTRIAQLRGPVKDYLSQFKPYIATDQNLYMAVFYPAARRWPLSQEFPALVQKQNPNIRTVADYVNFVNNRPANVQLSPQEWTALKDTAKALGVDYNSLYKLINFESGWNPAALNKISGARGLIQFMPSTATWMGFKKPLPIVGLLIAAGIALFLFKGKAI